MNYVSTFLAYLEHEKRCSPHTLRSYATDLAGFESYLQRRDFPAGKICVEPRVIRGWMVELLEEGVSSRSVNRKISALKSYYRFLLREGHMAVNPMNKVLSPKSPRRLPGFVEKEKMDVLLDEVEFGEDFSGIRNRLIIDLLYQTGMRLSELTGVKEGDVDRHAQHIRVLGKRNKERIIPVSMLMKEQIDRYLQVKREYMTGKSIEGTEGYLLVTDKGKRLYPKFVYRVVHIYLSLVTTLDRKSPHVLRHTFATHMLNEGAELNAIKELLGHANLAATQVYTHNTFEKLKKAYKQAHPRA